MERFLRLKQIYDEKLPSWKFIEQKKEKKEKKQLNK